MGHCVWWFLEHIWCTSCMQTAWIFTNRYVYNCICTYTDWCSYIINNRLLLIQLCLLLIYIISVICVFAFLKWHDCLKKCFPYSVGLKVHLSQQVQLPRGVHTLARELEPFFWTIWSVLGRKPNLWIVAETRLVFITVATLEMLESSVKVLNHIIPATCWHMNHQSTKLVTVQQGLYCVIKSSIPVHENSGLWYEMPMWCLIHVTIFKNLNNLKLADFQHVGCLMQGCSKAFRGSVAKVMHVSMQHIGRPCMLFTDLILMLLGSLYYPCKAKMVRWKKPRIHWLHIWWMFGKLWTIIVYVYYH